MGAAVDRAGGTEHHPGALLAVCSQLLERSWGSPQVDGRTPNTL